MTAGPTREFFDPVRFLSNPSSGKMGYALAEEAFRRGAKVTLVSGPVSISSSVTPIIQVTSAEEMYETVLKEASKADLIVMTAAVSDYRPNRYSAHKLKKARRNLALILVPTRDILKELGRCKRPGQVLVGFAAETNHVIENALQKIEKKNLDVIIANRVGATGTGFESDHNQAIAIFADGKKIEFPRMPKKKLASKILTLVMPFLH